MDQVMTLLVGLEERFDRLGHDTRVDVTKIGDTPIDIVCALCGDSTVFVVVNGYGGWSISDTTLDNLCMSRFV